MSHAILHGTGLTSKVNLAVCVPVPVYAACGMCVCCVVAFRLHNRIHIDCDVIVTSEAYDKWSSLHILFMNK